MKNRLQFDVNGSRGGNSWSMYYSRYINDISHFYKGKKYFCDFFLWTSTDFFVLAHFGFSIPWDKKWYRSHFG